MKHIIFIVAIIFLTLITFGQDVTVIKGILTNNIGTPISFCSVSIKGTQIAATTNDCGEFELPFPKEDFTIVFNGGYIPFEVRLKSTDFKNYEPIVFRIRKYGKVSSDNCKVKSKRKLRRITLR
jgi:hypothetical protein